MKVTIMVKLETNEYWHHNGLATSSYSLFKLAANNYRPILFEFPIIPICPNLRPLQLHKSKNKAGHRTLVDMPFVLPPTVLGFIAHVAI